jgi:hypothetical protein
LCRFFADSTLLIWLILGDDHTAMVLPREHETFDFRCYWSSVGYVSVPVLRLLAIVSASLGSFWFLIRFSGEGFCCSILCLRLAARHGFDDAA